MTGGIFIHFFKKERTRNEEIIYQQLEDAWDKLDKELDPNFHYIAK